MKKSAAAILHVLLTGVDPASGEYLPEDHILRRPSGGRCRPRWNRSASARPAGKAEPAV